MFIDYYGLKEQPFGMTPYPRFLHMSSMHREAVASLAYGIEADRGFLALIAEPGMGKTTLLYHLLERLRPNARTAFIFQTQCDSESLMRQIMHEFELNVSSVDPVEITESLKKLLLREAGAKRRVVLIVDEAQNLDNSVLETVRLLSNFETAGNKLLHIVLSGQPGLREKLAAPGLLQLRQRVSIAIRLDRFSCEETESYISHRLAVAGRIGTPLFTSRACMRIAALSQGIPRNINNLCFNAMSLGYAMGKEAITTEIVDEAGRDSELAMDSGERGSPRLSRATGVPIKAYSPIAASSENIVANAADPTVKLKLIESPPRAKKHPTGLVVVPQRGYHIARAGIVLAAIALLAGMPGELSRPVAAATARQSSLSSSAQIALASATHSDAVASANIPVITKSGVSEVTRVEASAIVSDLKKIQRRRRLGARESTFTPQAVAPDGPPPTGADETNHP